MKIAFCWFWDQAPQVYDNWRDGLRAAIELIGKEHHVSWFIGKEYPEDEFDAILLWDDSNSEFFSRIDKYHAKKGIFLTTNPQNFDNLRKLDVVYCESQPVYEEVRSQGIRAVKAFGTDTDFFKPKKVKKDIEYFYPATFSPWKRQSEIAHLGDKLLCIGTVQPDGQAELQECLRSGVIVKVGYYPAEVIRDCYQRSQKVIIPAIHGSERTVLEAMSCDIEPKVIGDNIKAKSLLQEYIDSDCDTPREFILKSYSAKKYAQNILRGLK